MSEILTIPRESLLSKLPDAGWDLDLNICEPKAPAESYAITTEDWMIRDFSPAWMRFRDRFMQPKNVRANWCRQYTRACAVFAGMAWEQVPDRPENCDPAFAEYWFERGGEKGNGHALCLVPVREGDLIVPRWYEPQTAFFVALTVEERRTCEFCRF